MATITASSGSANSAPVRSADSPARPLWQAPLFVLGLAALVGMAVGRPFAPVGPEQRLARELARARDILSRPDGDAQQALELAGKALEATIDFPDRAAEAAYLVGRAHALLAEKAEKADPSRALESYRTAQKYLEQAEHEAAGKAALADGDQIQLGYLLGKVGFHVGDDVTHVIGRLEEATPRVENRAEGWSLLTQAYLRLQPPNLQKALESNRKLRDLTTISDAELTAAKVQGAELLLRMGKPADARASLGSIPDQGPPDLRTRARLLRATSYQAEKQYKEAICDYQTTLADSRASIPDVASVWYNLGMCYRERELPKEAASAWQECVKLARGDEGPAAALLLAEVRLLDAGRETETAARRTAFQSSLEALTVAVSRVRSPTDWTNTLIGKPRALLIFEKTALAFRQANQFDLATQVIEPYGRLASPLAILVLRGHVASEWAAAKMEEARTCKTRDVLEKEALGLYAGAGEAFAEAAAQPGLKPPEQGNHLWASASAYRSAKDPVKVMEKLEMFVKLDVDKVRRGEAYFHLGEIYQQGSDAKLAETNYRLCIKQSESHFAHMARYQLAMMALNDNPPRVDEGLGALIANVQTLRKDTDAVALAQSLFSLGSVYYQRRDYRGVCRYLEDALGRFKENPEFKDNAEVTLARYQLADSYRQIAALENQSFLLSEPMSQPARAHYQEEHRRRLRQAAEEFSSLDAYLASEGGKDQLSAEQRTQVPFITAKCWFDLGEYDKALAIYERLIACYPEQIEGLAALGGAVQCHAARGQLRDVQQRLLQIRILLAKLPTMPEADRKAWDEWVGKATRELEALPANTEG